MLRNDDRSYGLGAIILHWMLALLLVGQFLLGLAAARVDSMALQFSLVQWHKSLGFLTLALVLLRLAWRMSDRPMPPLPGARPLEWLAAQVAHRLLYVLRLLTPLAGWALVSVSTLGVPSFVFNLFVMPDLPLIRSDAAESVWYGVHQMLAYALALLAAGHVAAALRHHYQPGSVGLGRMLGTTARSTESPGE